MRSCDTNGTTWITFSFACLHGDQNIDPGFINESVFNLFNIMPFCASHSLSISAFYHRLNNFKKSQTSPPKLIFLAGGGVFFMLARKHHTNPSIASIRIFIFANQVLIHLQMFIPNVFLVHGFRHNSVLTQAGQPKYSYRDLQCTLLFIT